MNLKEIFERWQFWKTADRIGPDIPTTYWKLYFKSTMRQLCQSKFHNFGEGSEFRLGAWASGCSKISIGKQVVIRPGSFLYSDEGPEGAQIIIEDKVLMGPAVHIYTNNHSYGDASREIIDQGYNKVAPVYLKKGCWLGAGVIVLPGVVVGRHCVIGAGSVVTKSVPDYTVAVGNPAKVIKKIKNKYETKNYDRR